MAPRTTKDTGPPPDPSIAQQEECSEGMEEFEFPRLLAHQLANAAVGPDAQLDSEGVTALVQSATAFLHQLTAAAQETATTTGHKSIQGGDVMKAFETMGFGKLAHGLEGDYDAFRAVNKLDRPFKFTSKAPSESKGKGKGTNSSLAPSKIDTANSSAVTTPSMDVEMKDGSQETRPLD
ncbi:hypothetical protein M422DRAFT_25770 [Sphaerobolus stellatus SS14]|nr:hypothetical protein M422DRAFT_25770 [Sphaerobolus stellatus SS14]